MIPRSFHRLKAGALLACVLAAQSLTLMCQGFKAANDIHPIVDVQRGYLLGGTRNGRWLKAETVAPLLKGQEKYRVYTRTSYLGQGVGSKPSSQGEPCPDVPFVTVSSGGGKSTMKQGVVAFGGTWNALPRTARLVDTTQPVYIGIVADLLRRHGLAKPKVHIRQIARVDLDGDGIDEVVISANNFADASTTAGDIMPSSTQAGDYSLLFVRKESKGKVKTLFIDQQYCLKTKTFDAPSRSEAIAFLDLNDDGKLEIVVRGHYYEGDGITVYRLAGDRLEEALSSGCGA